MSLLRGLYVILDEEIYGSELLTAARQVLEGGARLLQYRAKLGVHIAKLDALRELADEYHALLIINDDIEAAFSYGDGVHLGQEDMAKRPPAAIKADIGDGIVGISVHTIEQAVQAAEADYLGVGPYRETRSKTISRAPLGLSGLMEIVAASPRPVCAIGGIQLADIPEIARSGVAMFAVIGALVHAADRTLQTRAFCLAWANAQLT